MTNEMTTRIEEQVQPMSRASEATALIGMIERVALNPNADIDKMERLIEMQERIMARQARMAYFSALSEMQAEIPEIPERGRIVIRDKSDPTQVKQETPYALWEDVNEAIRPVLSKHGFALSFRTGLTSDGRVSVTAILSHREGHQEETTMVLAHDSTGSKNAVQAIGSSTSYGKRYATGALLNLTSRDGIEQDDDGKSSIEVLSKSAAREPFNEIRDEIYACQTVEDLERFWRSKAFKQEFQRQPKDWQKIVTDIAADRKADILALGQKDRGYVDPKDQFDRMVEK